MAFHWRADNGPLLVVFGSPLPSRHQLKTLKKKMSKLSWAPSDKKLPGSAHDAGRLIKQNNLCTALLISGGSAVAQWYSA